MTFSIKNITFLNQKFWSEIGLFLSKIDFMIQNGPFWRLKFPFKSPKYFFQYISYRWSEINFPGQSFWCCRNLFFILIIGFHIQKVIQFIKIIFWLVVFSSFPIDVMDTRFRLRPTRGTGGTVSSLAPQIYCVRKSSD